MTGYKLRTPWRIRSTSAFPIADWVLGDCYIEIERDEYIRSLFRALDPGGIVWEGKTRYASVEELFHELEKALAEIMEDD